MCRLMTWSWKRLSLSSMVATANASLKPGIATPASILVAPPSWRRVDFIADLHLQPSDEATFRIWQDYLCRTRADALFILGDLFEVWVGDDIVGSEARSTATDQADQTSAFAARCANVLKQSSQRLAIYFMHGNRDFLLGADYARSCGMALLADPSVLVFGNQRWLLSHGDQWCLADSSYMQFRNQVRSPQWRQAFLEQPLLERQAVARNMRRQSEARKHDLSTQGAMLADVDSGAACAALKQAHANTLIHGHTHRPADHAMGGSLRRLVLSDWDANVHPHRASVLRLGATPTPLGEASLHIERLAANAA